MTTTQTLRAPFPYFGGKSRASALIWERLGDVKNYVEPFAGSLAVLLGRPTEPKIETVNDLDCYLANFWRSVSIAPELVAKFADWPVNEADLQARHQWLVDQATFREEMKGNPDYFDPKIAGWWVWGLCCWIGSGWCSATKFRGDDLGNAGRGVNRQIPHLGDVGPILETMEALASRLRRVRVACGDWKRVLSDSVTFRHGLTGVVLGPPYETGKMDYGAGGTGTGITAEVRAWALESGKRGETRIALCGYEGEHDMPGDWACVPWKAAGGYGKRGGEAEQNSKRERIWFSPACLQPAKQSTQLSIAAE